MITKTEHFHLIEVTLLSGPGIDIDHRLLLAVGNTGRGDLNTVHLQGLQQCARNIHFFLGGEGDTLGLFTITQSRVQQFDVASLSV